MRLLEKSEFPRGLLEIPQPPHKLYLEGNLPPPDAVCLCVVGTRKYSEYGKKACEKLIASLAGKNVAIISGLAIGIDSIAHRAALDARLFTLAMPGSGLDPCVLYPAMNYTLAERIVAAGGGLLSEFEPRARAYKSSFPQRNRLMAGLSKAVLVIEAGLRSGTLITARLGTEYNRDVLAVPGSIYTSTATGPNFLIRLGATPITCPDDLFEALGFEREEELERARSHRRPNANDSQRGAGRKKTHGRTYTDCSSEEKKILTALERLARRGEPASRDNLIRAVEMSAAEVNVLLSMLEIKDHIRESFGLLEIS